MGVIILQCPSIGQSLFVKGTLVKNYVHTDNKSGRSLVAAKFSEDESSSL